MKLIDLAKELGIGVMAILYRLATHGADCEITEEQEAIIRTPRKRGRKVRFRDAGHKLLREQQRQKRLRRKKEIL